MGILDEAIREHLELKRQHGADDSELKQLEDDAFGPPERPGAPEASDTASEAATEFMQQPDLSDRAEAEREAAVEVPQPQPPARREPVADVQEAPEKVEEEPSDDEPAAEEPAEGPAGDEPDEGPAEEEQPAEEHEAVPSPPPPASHTTAERHAIADQPTEMYDVEEEFAAPGAESRAPDDEDLAAEEETEPRLGPAEPIAEPDLEGDEEEEDFFDEQRLSDELDAPAEPDSEEYEPASDEYEQEDGGDVKEADSEQAERPATSDADEDLLEDTPDFLEESPEDDELWFEQKPPKDFDFDD
jgi:hypothetical protein